MNTLRRKYLRFINPEYIKFVLDKDDQLVAFAIVMPSYLTRPSGRSNGKAIPHRHISSESRQEK